MKKELIVGLLGISLAAMPLTAFANDEVMVISANDTAATIQENIATQYMYNYGKIIDITKDAYGMQVAVKTADGEIVLNCGADTWIVDANTGLPMDLSERTTADVLIYYGPMMTMSLPPQSPAVAILGNVTAKSKLTYAVVEDIIQGKDGIMLVTDNGSRNITVNQNTRVVPFVTKNIVSMSDITVGSEVLLSYDVITLSDPGLATADKVVLLSQGEDTAPKGEVEMMPLRAAAEKMGYKVEWNNGVITLTKGGVNVKLTIGKEAAERNAQALDLFQAPELRDNVTYVPSDLLDMLK